MTLESEAPLLLWRPRVQQNVGSTARERSGCKRYLTPDPAHKALLWKMECITVTYVVNQVVLKCI